MTAQEDRPGMRNGDDKQGAELEVSAEDAGSPKPPYSVFSRWEKWSIAAMVSFFSLFR